MTFNADLAERVLAQIKDHPETWDQDYWEGESSCGTTRCIAGWALHLSGHKVFDFDTGSRISQRAAELLGIGDERASYMFWDVDDDLEAVERLVKHFANNPDDDSLPENAS